ncbi:MAG: tetratricopeptide repeat protein [Candidatus Hydrogenedentes bacterium]|nr:tetratricopeptide repeat protein [Candidatus Hydrogenedentota bacterium]
MALEKNKKSKRIPLEEASRRSDFSSLVEHIADNPLRYLAGATLIVLLVILGLVYRVSQKAQQEEVLSEYVQALDEEDTTLLPAKLEPLASQNTELQPEILYMLGDKAFTVQDYGKAEEAWNKVRESFPKDIYAPNAVEGLGLIAEERDNDSEKAIGFFAQVQQNWPDSFVARRQPLNIARNQEKLGNTEAAIAAYQEQVDIFPGSNVAEEASAALMRLRPASEAGLLDASADETLDIAPAEESVDLNLDLDEPAELSLPDAGNLFSAPDPASMPADEAPVEPAPADEAAADPAPAPADEATADPDPAPAPADEAAAEPAPAPADEVTAEPAPAPADEVAAEPAPAPADEAAAEPVPAAP